MCQTFFICYDLFIFNIDTLTEYCIKMLVKLSENTLNALAFFLVLHNRFCENLMCPTTRLSVWIYNI